MQGRLDEVVRFAVIRVIGVAITLMATACLAGCGGGGTKDQSAEIASKIGAASCSQTGYGLVDRITNKTTPIYDCLMHNLSTKCVTYENGIANDSTATVRLVFATALGSARPSCLTGG